MGSSTAWVTRNPVTTHPAPDTLASKSREMSGSAMLTMLMFSTDSIIPPATTVMAIQRHRGLARRRARIARRRAGSRVSFTAPRYTPRQCRAG